MLLFDQPDHRKNVKSKTGKIRRKCIFSRMIWGNMRFLCAILFMGKKEDVLCKTSRLWGRKTQCLDSVKRDLFFYGNKGVLWQETLKIVTKTNG